MTTTEVRPEGSPDDLADNDQKPCGHGRMLRKEDPRFIRGRGTYVDDVQLPGMLHLAVLRSPFAHARIVSIDTTAAQAHPKVKGRRDGRRSGGKRIGVDADPVQRRAGRSSHRQGPLPGPGGGLRGRRRPLCRTGCIGAHRRRVRPARSRDRRAQGARSRCPGDPHRPGRQERQSLFRLGDRRRGGHRGRVRQGRCRRQAGDRLPAGASRADGDLRSGRRSGPGHRQAHAVDHLAGTARTPHAVRVGGRAARAQDPGHFSRYRWWFRQQGADLPGIRVRDRRITAPRQAGQVDGRPQ